MTFKALTFHRPADGAAAQFSSAPPLSLYVHLPWCVRKCPYCDFNSHAAGGQLQQGDYIDALLRDLEADLPRVWGRPVMSVFIGGGTPSLFEPDAIARLLSDLRARLPLLAGAEITLEANPGTLDTARLEGFRRAGVNRLSLGVQSFHDRQLKALGRIHDAAAARRAIEVALSVGFERVNVDLTVRPAGAGRGAGAGRSGRRAGLRHGSRVLVPAHAGAEHRVPQPAAGAAGARPAGGDLRGRPGAPGGGRLPALRGVRLRPAGAGVPPQPQLLAVWRLPWHRRRGARQADPARRHPAPGQVPPAADLHDPRQAWQCGGRVSAG